MARPELTRLEKLQIDCSSAAQHFVHVDDAEHEMNERFFQAFDNLKAAVKAVDAQMAYERERGSFGTPPTGGKG